MKYPAYPDYKPSGIEWFGDVPVHWNVTKASFEFEIQLGKMLQPDARNHLDQEVPYLKAQHVQWGGVSVFELPTMWASPNERKQYEVREGDLLVCEGGEVGRAGIAHSIPKGTIFQNALHRVRPRKTNSTKYLLYLLFHAAHKQWFEILSNRATIAHFTSEKFQALPLALPPAPDQKTIVDFLDLRTAAIDTLIEKRWKLIERLQEKRSALISHTVTRGLPPDAARAAGLDPHPRLKPSSIHWLGDVQEHWEVKKLGWLFKYEKGPNAALLTKEYIGGNPGSYPVYSGQTENEGFMGVIDWYDFSFDTPVILVTTVGARAMTTRLVDGKFSLSQNCALICPRNSSIDTYYYECVMRTLFDYERGSISLIMQPSLRFEDLDRFHIPLPSLPEQVAISQFLLRETSKIDTMINKVESAIERLHEYRSALITAAVTGKIDVRGSGDSTSEPAYTG